MLRSLIGFDWRKSRAHLLLLSKFLHPQSAEGFAKADYWKDVLGETPQKAIKRFEDEGVLVTPGLAEHLEYKYRVSDLKAMLKQRGLPVSGRKADLTSRLVEADHDGMKKATAGLTVLHCSDHGQEIAKQYLAAEKEKRDAAEREVLAMLREGRYREASVLVASHEANQVFSRGINIDWKNHDPSGDVAALKAIFGPPPRILARLDQDKLEPLRLAAGMMYLWGTSEAKSWFPTDFETGLAMDNEAAARMFLFHGYYQADLEWYRRGGIKSVQIIGHKDQHQCEACGKLASRKYKLSEVPELPYEKCTSDLGCRCTTGAVV